MNGLKHIRSIAGLSGAALAKKVDGITTDSV